jgi:tRNA-specific 2-thiouridylase
MSKVCIGLSGGVDSAVSAALLKAEGHDVTGVFIKVWRPEFLECTWREDRLDAMRTAASLDIPFREIDLSEAYEQSVVSSMIRAYESGITPNPDVACNQFIKFGAFAKWAFSEGAERIATGHYARAVRGSGGTDLYRGMDADKDQSYFLYRIEQDVLDRTMFPIGEMHKGEVRALARRFGLCAAERPDSQGLCFVGNISMPEFLRRYIPVTRGVVRNPAGEAVGSHEGAALYTIGQRHGFQIEGEYARIPHYVIGIDVQTNTLVVSERRDAAAHTSVLLRDAYWIRESPSSAQALVQLRYHEPPVPSSITVGGGGTRVTFESPRLASPGQSLVVYSGERVLGGGVMSV